MADLILQTDPLEFQNSRQSTKIIFLQQELAQVQDYARDLEQIVKINKEALRIATSNSRAGGKVKSPQINESASTFDTNSSREEIKRLTLLVEQLTEENSKFLEIVEKAKKERNTAQSKALISEQICEEAQRHESETVHELEEKITDLRKLLQDKEYAIQELEKLKPIPEQEGVVIKYREVLNPTEQNMRFHNELDALNGMLAKVSKEVNKLQLEKQELGHLNYSLTTELAKVKATFSSPLAGAPKFGRMNNASEIPAGFQGGMFQPPIEFLDENSPCPSPLPSGAGNEPMFQSKAPVPKLDLSKAKQIQEQYAKKITQPQQQNYNNTYTVPAMDKLKQLEDELELTRKRYSHEMINNRLLGEELARLRKQLTQVISTNDILIKSNKRYEEKWQKIFYTLEFYKDFYHKYIDLITRGGSSTHAKSASLSGIAPKFDQVPKFNGKFFTNLDSDPEKMIKDLKKTNEDHGKQVNVSILEANEEESEREQGSADEGKMNNVIEFNKEQSKIYLLNLAKDLYVNSNLQKSSIAKRMLQNMKIGANGAAPRPIFKLKRSLSNPLEYVSERKQLVIEPKGGNANKLRKPRHDEQEEQEEEAEEVQHHDEEDTSPTSHNILNQDPKNLRLPVTKTDMADEMISFTVDPDDFNKNRMVEASFISNTDILENLRNN